MTFQQLRDRPHLSVSSVREYLDCGLRYKFSRIDKLQPEYTADVLVFGRAIHKTLEQYYNAKLEGEPISCNDLQVVFELMFQQAADACSIVRYRDGSSYTTLVDQGKTLIATYLDEIPDAAFTVLATEQPFILELEDLPVPVIGIIDLVEEDDDGTVVITEFKTSARKYTREEVERHHQLTLYGLAARRTGFADRRIILRIDCLMKTKTPRLDQFYAIRTDQDEQRLIRLLQEVWRGISQGIFIPNLTNWKCPTCEYKHYCDEYLTTKERRSP